MSAPRIVPVAADERYDEEHEHRQDVADEDAEYADEMDADADEQD